MRKHFQYLLAASLLLTVFSSCTKEIDIDIPDTEPRVVVEGRIEPDMPPFVILTRSSAYFDPVDVNSFLGSFVHDAKVTVDNGTNTVDLQEICASNLPDSLLPFISELAGISVENIALFDFCIYTSLNTAIWGETGKTYALRVESGSEVLTSSTTINQPIPLDSLWLEPFGTNDSLGFIWAILDDPGAERNAYRWMTQRINRRANGERKDPTFVPPNNSSFDDEFFNGLEFDLVYDRGELPNTLADNSSGDEPGFYKVGDTVVVKFSTIDPEVFRFIRAVETQVFSNGNPFAAPSTIPSNIEGGFGVWAGYGVFLDTAVFTL